MTNTFLLKNKQIKFFEQKTVQITSVSSVSHQIRSVGAGKLFVLDFPIHPGFIQSPYKSGDFQMPITLPKIKYGTRSIVHFEAFEQTLRLRLVSGPADK